jgi:hypothetical protein
MKKPPNIKTNADITYLKVFAPKIHKNNPIEIRIIDIK